MRVNKQNRIVLKLDPYRPDIRPASDVTVCNALHEAAMWHSRDGRDATARWYRRIGDAIVLKGLPLSEYTLSTHSLRRPRD